MYELNIKVRNKIATQTDKAEYVCGNSDYIAVFDLDSEWDAYNTKTARFSYNGSYTDVVFDGNQCPVPVITDTHCFHIGVYAGDLHTTTAARVPCRKSILCGDGAPADPTPDVYDQLMEKLNDIGEISEEGIAAAVDAYMAENPVAGAFTVHITHDPETDTYSADKTFAEIKAAYDAGRVVQGDYDGAMFALNGIGEDIASFGATYSADGASLQWDTLMMSADGSIRLETVKVNPEFELIDTIDCIDASYSSFKRIIDISAYRRVWVYGNQLSTPNSAAIFSSLNGVSLDYISIGKDESSNKTNFVILLDGTGPYAAAYKYSGTGVYDMVPGVFAAVNNPKNAGITAIGTGLNTLVLNLNASAWSLSGGTVEIWGEKRW